MTVAALTLIGLSLFLAVVVRAGVACLAREPRLTPKRGFPGVSILKPLRGADPSLEANLRSFFTHDYPDFELLFGVESSDDPAAAVVRGLMREFPNVHARLVASPKRVGENPKVNNLANLLPHARHELLLISDSNVRTGPGYVADMVARIEDPGVGLVVSGFTARDARGTGGTLERLHLNSFILGSMSAANFIVKQPVSVGKSMLFTRSHLAVMGGFEKLSLVLAEDQVAAIETSKAGLRTVQAATVLDNVIGRLSLHGFLSRQIRWASIRVRLTGPLYLAELLFQTTVIATLAVALSPVPLVIAAAVCAVLIKVLLDESADATFPTAQDPSLNNKRLGLRALWLVPVHDLLLAWVWLAGFVCNRIEWRGRHYTIGWGTRLKASGPVAAAPVAAEVVVQSGPGGRPQGPAVLDYAEVVVSASRHPAEGAGQNGQPAGIPLRGLAGMA